MNTCAFKRSYLYYYMLNSDIMVEYNSKDFGKQLKALEKYLVIVHEHNLKICSFIKDYDDNNEYIYIHRSYLYRSSI